MTKHARWAVSVALSLVAALPVAAGSSSGPPQDAGCAVGEAPNGQQPRSQRRRARRDRAIWIWETAFLEDPRGVDEVLRFARKQGARTLFLYAPVWRLEQKPDAFRCFLAEAHRRRFTVHALQGEPGWIYSSQRAGAEEFVASLARFQQDQPAQVRFDALHFDVEPQSLTEWNTESIPELSRHYLDFLRWSRMQARKLDLPLAVDAPPWYRFLPADSGTLLDAVLELADEVALMAYMDESWRIVIDSLPAVNRAEASGKGVWIGMSADPAHLPRRPRGRPLRKELERMRGRVEKAFPQQRSFRGVAIHDYVLYQRLFCEADCAVASTAARAGQ
ncbi:MAG: hypothetical protein L0099_14990 [Acidobacteria bacterium]|nr:hypothetical protein [Acidobacteriota bacterium]